MPFEDRHTCGRLVATGNLIGCQQEYLMDHRLHGSSKTVLDRDRHGELVDFNVVQKLKHEPGLSYEEYLSFKRDQPLIRHLRDRTKGTAMQAHRNAIRRYAGRRLLQRGLLISRSLSLRLRRTINRSCLRLTPSSNVNT